MNIEYGSFMQLMGQIPSKSEKKLCKLITKYKKTEPLGRKYYLEIREEEGYHYWKLYYDKGCIFAVQEVYEGYEILLTRKECVEDAIKHLRERKG